MYFALRDSGSLGGKNTTDDQVIFHICVYVYKCAYIRVKMLRCMLCTVRISGHTKTRPRGPQKEDSSFRLSECAADGLLETWMRRQREPWMARLKHGNSKCRCCSGSHGGFRSPIKNVGFQMPAVFQAFVQVIPNVQQMDTTADATRLLKAPRCESRQSAQTSLTTLLRCMWVGIFQQQQQQQLSSCQCDRFQQCDFSGAAYKMVASQNHAVFSMDTVLYSLTMVCCDMYCMVLRAYGTMRYGTFRAPPTSSTPPPPLQFPTLPPRPSLLHSSTPSPYPFSTPHPASTPPS